MELLYNICLIQSFNLSRNELFAAIAGIWNSDRRHTHANLKLINFRRIAKGMDFNKINIEYQYQILGQ